MVKVKFEVSVKYGGTRYPAHTPFLADEKDVPGLVQSGAIILRDETKEETNKEDNFDEYREEEDEYSDAYEEVAPEEPDLNRIDIQDDNTNLSQREAILSKLSSNTVPELIEFAEDQGIDLQGKHLKDDIISLIADDVMGE